MIRRIPAVLGWLVLLPCLAAQVIALAVFSATSARVSAVPPQPLGMVQETTQPAHVSLWLRTPDREVRV